MANLGRVDRLGDTLDRLVESLGKYCRNQPILPEDLRCRSALTWGPVLLSRFLWDRMHLDEAVDKHCRSDRKHVAVSAAAFVLAAHRLCEPGSEHGLARWLEHTFVCDREGRRWEPDWLAAEIRREGKYILKTDRATITAAEALDCYKQLNTVEQGFRDLKDVIEMRPIYHHKDDRVQAHIFVASLALFLKQVLAHELSQSLPEMSVNEAFAAMRSVGLSERSVDGQVLRLVSGGGRDARRVMAALGTSQIDPPKASLGSPGHGVKRDGKTGRESPK